MEQKSNSEILNMAYLMMIGRKQIQDNSQWNVALPDEIIINLISVVINLNDKQEAAEKYIKSKYPKVYKEVYGNTEE